MLGVGDDDLVDDYELTTTFRSQRRIDELRPTLEAAGVDVDAVRPYLSAERQVLASTLERLRARWGSIDRYLVDVGGLGRDDIDHARAALLEPG